MTRLVAIVLMAALACTACQKSETASLSMEHAAAAPAAPAGKAGTADAARGDTVVRRHIAMRHDLHLQTEANSVEAAWRTANQACEAAGCEVLQASVSHDEARRPAHALLDARVPPDKLDAFLKQLSGLGTIGQHNKTAEDKTDEVIDVEARIRNMAEFRDNLRRLLTTKDAKLKDLIEVERELVRAQSELDSLSSRRKLLAQLTDKVRVTVRISARPAVLEEGVWSPVGEAVTGAGRLLARSLGGLISVVVAVLPWAVVLFLLGLGLRALWRRRKA